MDICCGGACLLVPMHVEEGVTSGVFLCHSPVFLGQGLIVPLDVTISTRVAGQ